MAKGILTSEDGKILYEGNWDNGKQNGQGNWMVANGNVYQGEFKNGKRHGQGTMTTNDLDTRVNFKTVKFVMAKP